MLVVVPTSVCGREKRHSVTGAASHEAGTADLSPCRHSADHGQGRDVLVYFNNDLGGHAVRNARELRSLVAGG